MAAHAAWKGHLKISLVTLPVQAYTVAESSREQKVTFNQLHDVCKSRIRYKKTCPIHGEVPASEIVSGYEYAKGEYVLMERDELEEIALPGERSIQVETFVPLPSIDPEYYSGQAYFLVPDGTVGARSYELIRRGLQEGGLAAIGEVVISKRQKLAAVHATEDLLVMDVLHYHNEIRKAEDYAPQVPHATANAAELKLLRSLLEEMTEPEFDASRFRDDYSDNLREALDAKIAGREVVVPESKEPVEVISIMDALRKSLKTKSETHPRTAKKAQLPQKKTRAPARRRKSG